MLAILDRSCLTRRRERILETGFNVCYVPAVSTFLIDYYHRKLLKMIFPLYIPRFAAQRLSDLFETVYLTWLMRGLNLLQSGDLSIENIKIY